MKHDLDPASARQDGYNAGLVMREEREAGENPDGRAWLALAAQQGTDYYNEFQAGFKEALA